MDIHGNIEKMGTGINRMKEACKEAGIPELEFIIIGFFTSLFRRRTLENFGINETQNKILELVKNDPGITTQGMADSIKNSIAYCGLVCKPCHLADNCDGCKSDNNCCGCRSSAQGCYQYSCCILFRCHIEYL